MKTFKSNIFAFAFLAMGTIAGLTSCDKDPETGGSDYSSENIEGKYYGTHNLEIPANILDALSSTLPPDTLDLEAPYDSIVPVDLTAGFEDTLEIRIVSGEVKVSSSLLDITIDGTLSGDNKLKIAKTEYDELNLGTSVKAEDASLATNKDVEFKSADIGSSTDVKLRLTANKIGSFAIPLTITTTSTFTKYEN